jgi:serine/threonine-protein kinase
MTKLGKYILHENLGQGGFATVYRATHATLQTEVAVKLLSPALVDDEKSRQRFIREAQSASALNHPHIAQVIDLDEDGDQFYIVMDYFPGGDLKRWAEAHAPLARSDLLRILGQMAAALDYAHAQGMLHRDVKPGNILIDLAGNAHLGDFGLVRPADAPHLTQVGSVVGTATYIAPEQAESRPDIDARADQYSLAVVAYELLAGAPPFSGDNSTAVSLLHITKPPPAPSSQNPAVPVEVDDVLLKGLKKAPAERYPTCAALVKALEEAFHLSDQRRLREALEQARGLLAEGKFAEVRSCLEYARSLLGERPELAEALVELDQKRHQAEAYEQGVKAWQSARQKAQAVLELLPDYPDPQGVFATLKLRKPRWHLPPVAEIARQAGVGLLLGLPVVALLLYLAFWWITREVPPPLPYPYPYP